MPGLEVKPMSACFQSQWAYLLHHTALFYTEQGSLWGGGLIWVLVPLHLSTGQKFQDFNQNLSFRMVELFPLLLTLSFSGKLDTIGNKRLLESWIFMWKGASEESVTGVWIEREESAP